MGALQRLVNQILTRVRGTTPSQRIALLLGGALVGVALIWLLNWAASPELVPLLDQDLAAEDLAQVRAGIAMLGESADVRGNRIYVRATANRPMLIAQLQQLEKLPTNTSTAFANLIKETSPWISGEEADRRWTVALQDRLGEVLRQLNGVKTANVFLNLGARKGFSRTPPSSSASVQLVMRHGEEVPRNLALAAARLVAGAVSGLPAQNVEVVDAAGKIALAWDEESDAATQLERRLAKEEQRYAAKIRQQIPDGKALVSVQIELNTTASATQSEEPTQAVTVSDRTTNEKTARGRRAEEPGVTPNVGVAAGGAAALETTEKETAESESVVGKRTKSESTPAGEVRQVTAAISLSYSYLAGVFKRLNPGGADPTDKQIEDTFQQERGRLLPQLVQLVRPQNEQNVAISRYYDGVADAAPTSAAAGRLDEAVDLLKKHGAVAGLGLLSLISLALMFRLSHRQDVGESFGLELGLPEDAIAAAKAAAADMTDFVGKQQAAAATAATAQAKSTAGGAGATRASGGVEVVADMAPGHSSVPTLGETELASPIEQAAVTEGLLVAQEVDAATVQTRKMLEQVAQMVNSDSESVATLVEQWLQREQQHHEESA